MKPPIEKIAAKFNRVASSWIMARPNLYHHITNLHMFMVMNSDGYIDVRLNCLSERYFTKHIKGKEWKYCDLFVEKITPDLMTMLSKLDMHYFIFSFIFSGYGVNTTRVCMIVADENKSDVK